MGTKFDKIGLVVTWVVSGLLVVTLLVMILLTSLSCLVDDVSVWTVTPEAITLVVANSSVQTSTSVVTMIIVWLSIETYKS